MLLLRLLLLLLLGCIGLGTDRRREEVVSGTVCFVNGVCHTIVQEECFRSRSKSFFLQLNWTTKTLILSKKRKKK